MNKTRKTVAGIMFAILSFMLINTLYSAKVYPGLSVLYNKFGSEMAPNQVALVVFDWRGYDTLGECVILVCGVLALSMLYGRGLLREHEVKSNHSTGIDAKPTLVLEFFTSTLIVFSIAYGVYLTLGGHITPGGGFQGGSLVASGVLLSLVVYGRKYLIPLGHVFLVRFESVGLILYILLGLSGLVFSGFFLYNLGIDYYQIVPASLSSLFNYPDAVNAGILPYLNLAVMLKVSAGLSTILLVLLEVKDHD